MDQAVQLAARLVEVLGRAYPGVRGDGVLMFDPNDAAQVAAVARFKEDHSESYKANSFGSPRRAADD
jgi:hypothetical protein